MRIGLVHKITLESGDICGIDAEVLAQAPYPRSDKSLIQAIHRKCLEIVTLKFQPAQNVQISRVERLKVYNI